MTAFGPPLYGPPGRPDAAVDEPAAREAAEVAPGEDGVAGGYLDAARLGEVVASASVRVSLLRAVGRGWLDARVLGGRTCLRRSEVERWLRIEAAS